MWFLANVTGKAAQGFRIDVTEYAITSVYRSDIVEKAIEILDNVTSMTPCRISLFQHSTLKFSLQDGSQVRTWTNRGVGGDHVFLADPQGEMLYGGFVWLNVEELKAAIKHIHTALT